MKKHLARFPDDITYTEKGRLYVLSKNVLRGTLIVGKDKKHYADNQIAEMIELSPRRYREFINKMLNCGIVRKKDDCLLLSEKHFDKNSGIIVM